LRWASPIGYGRLAPLPVRRSDGLFFVFAGKDPDNVPYLRVAADDRVHLLFSLARSTRSVPYFESASYVLSGLSLVTGEVLTLASSSVKRFSGYSVVLEQRLHLRRSLGKDAQHQMFHGNVIIAELLGHLFGKAE
jgi:hypothetical protein